MECPIHIQGVGSMVSLYGSQSNKADTYIDGSDDGAPVSRLRDLDAFGFEVSNNPMLCSMTGDLVAGHRSVVRHDPDGDNKIPLGVVGRRRGALQNSDVLDFLEEVAGNNGIEIKANRWGHVKSGAVCWVQFGVNGEMFEPVRGDEVHREFIARWGHDGTVKFTGAGSTFQPICNNQMNLIVAALKSNGVFGFKVTENISARMDNFLKFHENTGQSFHEYKEMCEFLVRQPMSSARWERFQDVMNPIDENNMTPKALSNARTRRDGLTQAFDSSPGQELRGSNCWRALNAYTYQYTNGLPGRSLKTDTNTELDKQGRRWMDNMAGPSEVRQAIHVLVNQSF